MTLKGEHIQYCVVPALNTASRACMLFRRCSRLAVLNDAVSCVQDGVIYPCCMDVNEDVIVVGTQLRFNHDTNEKFTYTGDRLFVFDRRTGDVLASSRVV